MPPRALVEVQTAPPYEVAVGAGVLGELAALVAARPSWALVADGRVAALHGAALPPGAAALVHLPPGEACKDFARLGEVLETLAAAGLERGSLIVTLGGGAASDLGGLAAALFLRGIDCIACPTTLLAMVDASVGGKTAINLAAGKNLAGAFHQPRRVLADVSTLESLPLEEWRSGLGEVAKTWLVAGAELEPLLEGVGPTPPAAGADSAALVALIAACVATKARVVAEDEFEAGPRKTLNLGHTFAHAIEHVAGYGRVRHGVAVAVGLVLASEYAARAGVLLDAELPARIARLLSRWHLPTGLAELEPSCGPLQAQALIGAMAHDKKNARGKVRLVLPRRAGELAFDVEAREDLLRAVLASPPRAERQSLSPGLG